MTEKGEIVSIEECELVAPADAEKVLQVMKKFEEFKRKALTPDDYVVLDIRGERRPYIKKSGWLKYALACHLSLEKIEERVEDQPDGTRVYHYTYRAVAPNGRYADAVGSASTEERDFAHLEHDVRSLAQTRACNRAIANLIAGGEVSAEEMVGVEKAKPSAKTPAKHSVEESVLPTEPPPAQLKPRVKVVRFLKEVPKLVAVDEATGQFKELGPFKPEDAAGLPATMAESFIRQGIAKEVVEGKPEKKPNTAKALEWLPLRTSDGKEWGSLNLGEGEADILFSQPVNAEDTAVTGGLFAKCLDTISSKEPEFSYIPDVEAGRLKAVKIFGPIDADRAKKIASYAAWAAQKASERG